jgi:hypothetical protein
VQRLNSGGVLEDVNPTVKAIIIADGAHHLDLRGANKDDPESVTIARQEEVALIKKWLSQKRKDNLSKDNNKYVHF